MNQYQPINNNQPPNHPYQPYQPYQPPNQLNQSTHLYPSNQPNTNHQPNQPYHPYSPAQLNQYPIQPSQLNPNIQQNQPNALQNAVLNGSAFRNVNAQYKPQGQNYDGQPSLYAGARKNFISKVYTLLSLQLLLTVIIGYVGYTNQTFKRLFGSPAVLISVSCGLLAISIMMCCCRQFYKRFIVPIFIIFTLLFSILVAASIAAYTSKAILMAVVATLVITIALTIYAWNTESDLTGMGPYLMVFGIVLFMFGIVAIFMWNNPIIQLIYSCLAALLFGVYLIYDTQLVLGRGQYKYDLDDTFQASLQLYIDIIQLFLNILRIIGSFTR